jgi:hypothetical protein
LDIENIGAVAPDYPVAPYFLRWSRHVFSHSKIGELPKGGPHFRIDAFQGRADEELNLP